MLRGIICPLSSQKRESRIARVKILRSDKAIGQKSPLRDEIIVGARYISLTYRGMNPGEALNKAWVPRKCDGAIPRIRIAPRDFNHFGEQGTAERTQFFLLFRTRNKWHFSVIPTLVLVFCVEPACLYASYFVFTCFRRCFLPIAFICFDRSTMNRMGMFLKLESSVYRFHQLPLILLERLRDYE